MNEAALRLFVQETKQSLASAPHVGRVKELLTQVVQIFQLDKDDRDESLTNCSHQTSLFFEQHFTTFAHFLMNSVLPNWISCFTTDERAALFDVFFLSAVVPAVPAFIALTSTLTAQPTQLDSPEKADWNNMLSRGEVVIRETEPNNMIRKSSVATSSSEAEMFVGEVSIELLARFIKVRLAQVITHFLSER